MTTMWAHSRAVKDMQSKLIEREQKIHELESSVQQRREFQGRAKVINSASQHEIMALKKEIKRLQQSVEENDSQQEEFRAMQHELAHMHTMIKKQRNRLLMATAHRPETRSQKKKRSPKKKKSPKPLPVIQEEPERQDDNSEEEEKEFIAAPAVPLEAGIDDQSEKVETDSHVSAEIATVETAEDHTEPEEQPQQPVPDSTDCDDTQDKPCTDK